MNIKISKNKHVNALLVLMLFSAAVHMVILFCLAIIKRDFYVLNYFNIIGLDILFPTSAFNTFLGNALSLIIVVIIYFLILKIDKGDASDA